MADKSEFVDMISEATRQVRRRIVRRAVEPVVKETSRLSHWPPDRVGAVAHGDADAVEDAALEIQGLGLEVRSATRNRQIRHPNGCLICFVVPTITNGGDGASGGDAASGDGASDHGDASGDSDRRAADRNRSRSPGSGGTNNNRDNHHTGSRTRRRRNAGESDGGARTERRRTGRHQSDGLRRGRPDRRETRRRGIRRRRFASRHHETPAHRRRRGNAARPLP